MVDASRNRVFSISLSVIWLLSTAATGLSAQPIEPSGFDLVGINLLREQDPSLTGRNTTVALICRSVTYIDGKPQNDYRPDLGHQCFSKTNFSLFNDTTLPANISEHSTAICSILFGRNSGNTELSPQVFDYRGLTYEANAQAFEFWYFLKKFVFVNAEPEADVISASIGSVFEDWWTRGIEAMVEQYGVVVVAGIGNGANSHDLPLYPAAGANVIAVGVVEVVTDSNSTQDQTKLTWARPEASSCGPTEDKRCKPDIVAPGNYLTAAAYEPNVYRPCGNYSSFATPVVAGTAALLVQKAKTDDSISEVICGRGGNNVIKAILMNTAKKLPYWHKGSLSKDDDHDVPLDYMHGAGVLDALGAYNTLVAGRFQPGDVAGQGWDLGTLEQKQQTENSYEFVIEKSENKMITVTLTWNRHYQKQYPFEALSKENVDIQLQLWALSDNDELDDILLDYSDSKVDNVEHIYCMADANYARYEIVVSFANDTDSVDGLMETYGLAWKATDKGQVDDAVSHDLNGDGRIDSHDMVVLLENIIKFSKGTDDYLLGDVNNDGKLDMNDVDSFVSQIEPDSR